jgi:OOP family OmpA-OmpF porin
MRVSRWMGAAALAAGSALAGAAGAAENGWYVVGFGGESSVKNVDQGELDQNLIDAFGAAGLFVVEATSTLDDSDTGFGAALGFQTNENFAMELAYVDLGELSYDATGTVTDGFDDFATDFTLGQSASGPVFSLLGIWPIGERFSVFGRAGIALMMVDADVRVTIDDVTATDSVSSDRSNLMYGAGGEFNINDQFGVRLAWDRYANVGSEDLTGDVDIDLVTLGVRYSFR